MANMQLTKTPMAEQDPQVRNQNFLEVAQGYTLEAVSYTHLNGNHLEKAEGTW